MIETIHQYEVLIIGVLALLAIAFFVANGGDVSKLFGPKKDLFNPVRRAFIPIIDDILSKRGGYAETGVYEREYAGTYEGTLEDLENALYEAGYRRYPLASIATTPDGRSESASWAKHDHFWSSRQDHARIFDSNAEVEDNRKWDLYVHNEYTAHHPMYMFKHYAGEGMRFEEGIRNVQADLESVGIDLAWESTKDEFEPPKRNNHNDTDEA